MSRARQGAWGRRAVDNRRHDRLANLDPYEFERVIADYYRRQGFEVEHCGTGNGRSRFDGGIDLKLRRDGTYTIVQCKRENALQVTHNVGHELLGIMLTEGANQAIVINTGEFTAHAIASANKEPRLRLIDGDEVRWMLPEYAVPVPQAEWSTTPRPRAVSKPRRAKAPNRRNRRREKSIAEVIGALMAAVVALVIWQLLHQYKPPTHQAKRAQPATLHATPAASQQPHPAPIRQRQASPSIRANAPPPVQTPEVVDPEESKRRADEAIKVLEWVPEM